MARLPLTEIESFQEDGKNNNQLALPEVVLGRIHSQKGEQKLDLSLCRLKTVPLDEIRVYFGDPVCLDLSFNMISQLSVTFARKMTNLRKLDLSRNCLKMLPNDFGNLHNLEFLDLRENNLEKLPVSMSKMEKLYYLNISENQFRAPLSNFLRLETVRESAERNLGNVANHVVRFLKEIEQMTSPTAAGDALPERPRLMDRKRSVTFDSAITSQDRVTINALFPDGSSTDEEKLNEYQKRADYESRCRRPKKSSRMATASNVVGSPYLKDSGRIIERMTGLGCVFGLMVLTPLVLSFMVGSAYLDAVAAKDKDGYFAYIWTYYKIVHIYAEYFCCGVRLRAPLFVPGQIPKEISQTGFFYAFFNSIANMFSYVMNFAV